MLEELIKQPAALARHKNAPYLEERERYLAYCAEQGYMRSTLLFIAKELVWAAHKFSVYPETVITLDQIKAAATGWEDRQRRCGRPINPEWTQRRFIQVVRPWLRFLGRLHEPVAELMPFEDMVLEYTGWMEHEKGLSPETIQRQCNHVAKFLRWYRSWGRPFPAVRINDVDDFLAVCGTKGCSRVSIKIIATTLRSFFRYAAMNAWCSESIASAIQGPRIYRQEGLPLGPSWHSVKRLVDSMDTDRPCDIRDRAIVLLLAVYGLRSGEVKNLMLEDLDWERNLLVVRRAKNGATRTYPLVPVVGNAIVHYLQEVRPRCSQREVFLTLHPPFRTISKGCLYSLVKTRMVKLGIHAPRRGPHSLRHACATHLVSEGFSLKEIGDHLGHRSLSSTRIYAKVDLPGLRKVASFDIGGLI